MNRLEDKEIEEILRSAFLPFKCHVMIYDYDDKLKFKVFTGDGAPVSVEYKSEIRLLRDPSNLKTLIEGARLHVSEKGYPLDSWRFPEKDERVK